MLPGVPNPRLSWSAQPRSIPGVPTPQCPGVPNPRVSLEGGEVRSKTVVIAIAIDTTRRWRRWASTTLHPTPDTQALMVIKANVPSESSCISIPQISGYNSANKISGITFGTDYFISGYLGILQ